jgi:hypothetical protein
MTLLAEQRIKYSALEIMTEVAWQVGDSLNDAPRAESRWYVVDLAQRIIDANIITVDSEDIDETIRSWLIENGEV